MTEETQYDVFLSHNSQDKPAVERELIRRKGNLDCSLLRTAPAGSHLRGQ